MRKLDPGMQGCSFPFIHLVRYISDWEIRMLRLVFLYGTFCVVFCIVIDQDDFLLPAIRQLYDPHLVQDQVNGPLLIICWNDNGKCRQEEGVLLEAANL